MSDRTTRGLLISDFTLDNLAQLFSHDTEAPLVEAVPAPFQQVQAILLDPNHAAWTESNYDFALVWTQPQAMLEDFGQLLDYQPVDRLKLLSQVDEFCMALKNLPQKVRFVFVPTWALPQNFRGYGMLDMKPGTGIGHALREMNLRLAQNLGEESNIFVLDTSRWLTMAGSRAFNPKLWYMAKVPFGPEVFSAAIQDVKAALNALGGNARKLVLLDLDETLWGGIVGDDGWENLRLGGHDHIGEAYVDFQRALKALTNRGILLGIISKNEESIALEAIDKHPEMVLRQDDFAGWRINWQDKVKNIMELVEELNLGLQSVVFLDDNPMERAWVRESLPEVLVPDLPEDKMLYPGMVWGLHCFDAPSVSTEDLQRARMYVTERKRKQLRTATISLDEWLSSLEIVVTVETMDQSNLSRTAQLLNKTNQMNLSTRRMTESELTAWANEENHHLWAFRVSDKFGDSGLTGIISLAIEDSKGRIVDFILSCRVMGRKVEESMVSKVYQHALSLGLEELYAEYLPTAKNKPCLDFWKRSGFDYHEETNRFSWSMHQEYPVPQAVRIIDQ